MSHTFHVSAHVPADRKIEVTLPPGAPTGDVELTLMVTAKSKARTKSRTKAHDEEFRPVQELIDSGAAGIWAGRTEIEDPAAYARELRQQSWKRSA